MSCGKAMNETRDDNMMRCFLLQYKIPVIRQQGLSTTTFVLNSFVYRIMIVKIFLSVHECLIVGHLPPVDGSAQAAQAVEGSLIVPRIDWTCMRKGRKAEDRNKFIKIK